MSIVRVVSETKNIYYYKSGAANDGAAPDVRFILS